MLREHSQARWLKTLTARKWFVHGARVLVLLLLYWLASHWQMAFSGLVVQPFTAALWLPSAIGIITLFIWGYGYLPVVVAGLFIALADGGMATGGVIVSAIGGTIEALLATAWLKRVHFQMQMKRLVDTVLFILLAVVLAPLANVFFVALMNAMFGIIISTNLMMLFFNLWLASAVGILCTAPAIFVWSAVPFKLPGMTWVYETAGMIFLLFAAGMLLSGWLPASLPLIFLASFLILMAVIWAVYRYGFRSASAILALISLFLVVITLSGRGLLLQSQGWFQLQATLLALNFIGLMVSGAISESALARETLITSHADLEKKVRKRTIELAEAVAGLQSEVEARHHLTNVLEQSEKRYKGIVSDFEGLICRWGADGRLLFVNPAYCHYFGVSPEAVLGQLHFVLRNPEQAKERLARLQLITPEYPVRTHELQQRRMDGEVRWLQWTDRALFNDAGEILEYQSVGIDITRRKMREMALEAANRIASPLHKDASTRAAFTRILDELINLYQLDAALSIWYVDGGSHFCLRSRQGQPAADYFTLSEQTHFFFDQVIEEKRIRYFNPGDDLPLVSMPPLKAGSNAIACIPLSKYAHHAVLCLSNVLPFDVFQQNQLESLVELINEIFERTLLAENARNHLQRITALRTVDSAITSQRDLRVVLGLLTDQLMDCLGVDAAGVRVVDKETQTLKTVHGSGFKSLTYQKLSVDVFSGVTGQVIKTRQMSQVARFSQRYDPLAIALQQSGECHHTYLGIPLVSKGETLGVLELFGNALTLSDAQVGEYLQTAADQAAIAIENATLFAALQKLTFENSLTDDSMTMQLVKLIEARLGLPPARLQHLADLTVRTASLFNVNEMRARDVYRGAMLHDVGRLFTTDDDATASAARVLQPYPQHARLGYEFLKDMPAFTQAAVIALHHHERWDGAGYPLGLRGEEIPLVARIFAVCARFDELMNQAAPDGARADLDAVLNILRDERNYRLDAAVVEAFIKLRPWKTLDNVQ